MVNTDDFIKRLELIFDYYSITSSSFADKIGVQRSSLSHLLSGRNKPSLDLILKIISVYPEVDLYWILNGKGNFPKNNGNEKNIAAIISDETTTLFSLPSNKIDEVIEEKKIDEERKIITSDNTNLNSEKITEKIVFFFTDGSFKEYFVKK